MKEEVSFYYPNFQKAVKEVEFKGKIESIEDLANKYKNSEKLSGRYSGNIHAFLKGRKKISEKFALWFASAFGYDFDWIIESGAMGDYDTSKENFTKAPEGRFKRNMGKNKDSKIPFYDTDFEAGKGVAFHDDIRNSEPSYFMDVPDFAGCTAFRTYGKSMQPLIESGTILFGTKEDGWQDYIEKGQIYGIVLHDGKRLLKRISKSSKGDDYFKIVSANPDFDEDDIPKKIIKNIWLIHGWLNKNT